jgi:sugar phosphate isomerase/epimerase
MNRREFSRLAATAAAWGAARAAFGADSPAAAWKLGIITDEVDADLARVLSSFYPKYQLRWAEIRNVQLDGKSRYVYTNATPAQLREIRKQVDDAGVKISVMDTAVYKIPLPGTQPLGAKTGELNPGAGEYKRQMDDLKRASDAAHILGTDRVRIFAFQRIADPNSIFDRIVDELHTAIAAAKQQDVILVLENEFSCNVATGAESARLFKAIPDRRLMHNWDPGNCIEAGEDPFPKGWDQLDHTRIAHIHLKDAEGRAWKPIGGGKIDFIGQFAALKKMKYAGTMSLETHYRNAQNDPYTSSVESMDGLFNVLKKV